MGWVGVRESARVPRSVVAVIALLALACQVPHAAEPGPLDLPCWAGEPMGTHGRSAYYCEANRPACVAQPANTVSSGLYVVAAFAIAMRARARARQMTVSRAETIVTWAIVGECALLGVASAWYHAALTHLAERFDMSGTYGTVAAMLAFVVARTGRVGRLGGGGLVALAFGAHVLAAVFKYRIVDDVVFPVALVSLVIASAALARAGRADARLVGLGAVMAGLAGALRLLDVAKVGCAPQSLLQGHAAWHLLTALAFFLGFEGLARTRTRERGRAA